MIVQFKLNVSRGRQSNDRTGLSKAKLSEIYKQLLSPVKQIVKKETSKIRRPTVRKSMRHERQEILQRTRVIFCTDHNTSNTLFMSVCNAHPKRNNM